MRRWRRVANFSTNRGLMTRTINAAGLALVREHEGVRLEAYQDTSAIWTIGYGHTRGVKPGDCINREQAAQLLEADLSEAERAVDALVRVTLTDTLISDL